MAICGPTTPLTTPAASTHEMARALKAGFRRVGGGEAVLLDEGARGADDEQGQLNATKDERGWRAPPRPLPLPDQVADDEAGAATDALHQQRGGDRGKGRTDDERGDRKRGELNLIGRQQRHADEATGADRDRSRPEPGECAGRERIRAARRASGKGRWGSVCERRWLGRGCVQHRIVEAGHDVEASMVAACPRPGRPSRTGG